MNEDEAKTGQEKAEPSADSQHKAPSRTREVAGRQDAKIIARKKEVETIQTKDRGAVRQNPAEAFKEIWRKSQRRKALIHEEVNRRAELNS